MRTKREQVQAHRFVIRRIVSGLVQGNPEALEFPMRRTAGSMIGGLAVALLVFAGFWVVGLIFGSADWRDKPEGAIVIDEEAGATFVYLDKALYPVENITSARLFLEKGADAPVFQTSSADLLDVPRGDLFGIENAPDQVPPADRLVGLPWQVCSAPKRGNDKEQVSHITLSAPKADDRLRKEGLLVVAGEEYSVLWNDLRFAVGDPAMLAAIDFQADEAVSVDPVFLAGIRQGPEFKPPTIPGDGDAHEIPEHDDAENGDFFKSADTVYVLTSMGFAKATHFDQMLLNNGVPPTPGQLPSTALEQVGTHKLYDHDLWPETLDDLGEPPLSESGVICAVYDSSDSDDVAIATYPPGKAPDAITGASATTKESDADEVSTAEHVWTPAGKGALVREQGSESSAGGTVYLITGTHRYGLAEDAVESLGYSGATPTPVPWSLVALVPEGPELSRTAATDGFKPFPKAE